jgi:ABC-2 type transport system permease protein
MARWELAGLRMFLPLVAVVQVLLGVGLVLGFGLFMPEAVPARTVLYVSTGTPVFNLYLLGLVVMPQTTSQQRIADTYDFLQSLPVPRMVGLTTWLTVTLVAGVPGMVASLVTARLRYGFRPDVSASVVAAVLLTALTATVIGSAMAHAVPHPMVTLVLTQVLNFVALGFAPIAFPADQLPGWLATVNHVLPFESMGVTMRAALSAGPVDGVGRAYLVLAGWSVACAGLAGWALRRRG